MAGKHCWATQGNQTLEAEGRWGMPPLGRSRKMPAWAVGAAGGDLGDTTEGGPEEALALSGGAAPGGLQSAARERLWHNQEALWRNEPEEPQSAERERWAALGQRSVGSASLPHHTGRETLSRGEGWRWCQAARPVVR